MSISFVCQTHRNSFIVSKRSHSNVPLLQALAKVIAFSAGICKIECYYYSIADSFKCSNRKHVNKNNHESKSERVNDRVESLLVSFQRQIDLNLMKVKCIADMPIRSIAAASIFVHMNWHLTNCDNGPKRDRKETGSDRLCPLAANKLHIFLS